MRIHNLGFPRIGQDRELKFALEDYWRGELSAEQLLTTAQNIRRQNWQTQFQAGIDFIPVGDFALYDHVLNTSLMLGIIPDRARQPDLTPLDTEFLLARGRSQQGCGCNASDMTKWFNTNYHYIVPELPSELTLDVQPERLITEIREARQQGFTPKPVLVGPLTYLWLSQYDDDPLTLLPTLLAGYQKLLDALASEKVDWLQIDEPILVTELDKPWQHAFISAYNQLKFGPIKPMLATYFGDITHQTHWLGELPIKGIHLDCSHDLDSVVPVINALPEYWSVSLGVISGRDVWRTDLNELHDQLQPLYEQLNGRLWLAPSCSLLHCPVDLNKEQRLDRELYSWLAFAKQKCQELALLRDALTSGDTRAIEHYSEPVVNKSSSPRITHPKVRDRQARLSQRERTEPYAQRKQQQNQRLGLPPLPTTTIGSFPQTQDIRQTRARWRKGDIGDEQYQQQMQAYIGDCIKQQEALGLDVLVHGEPERNDMVEYFADYLEGVATTDFGWVQSYGSRCVKPPLIYGDIQRTKPMTVQWLQYAQSLTDKPVKGMLTGPVTILQWSFVRDDLPRSQVAEQIALAVSDEVEDLIQSGIRIIQIDEPALREGLPLKRRDWEDYLVWAVSAFKLASARAPAQVQIHSHMCYAQFEDILPAIEALDADVLTLETSRSQMALLDVFKQQAYSNDLGPGVYDIHSPNVPDDNWLDTLLTRALEVLPPERLWVNPDCGLKTRNWPETKAALGAMVQAAKRQRHKLVQNAK
ncbi:5-methyltetrahydropteroyltriglutamate--homocysteine S-methyltransferase [Saliniradius amylolyticus]|uniref:5-methyltetrahydropteroyltriglutamate--homocysteine methyltransferase n=1 Tax=Saliniradius amylolyticus TaxID=2183582 RepID=A0A2S2E621_9ALTE|nr:5-methyltetrahydropteroyltriglutamate--homocysteine S-methyltransferase [Saliniradius amylolyticus]AWL13083.1 5-methyltetrahydropteroyltriglutamate--homocysteine S-methyltransferase [Saliniradius amylolyticus]